MSYNEQLQEIVRQYRESGEPWPINSRAIAAWAIQLKKWEPNPASIIEQCADHLSRAMREEYIIDPQNRRVRSKHAARIEDEYGKQTTFWDDIQSAPPEHMYNAFQLRRRGVVSDCKQLKTDVDSYNENNTFGAHYQLSLNFTLDVQEYELSEV